MSQKLRKEKNFNPLVHEDFNWDNEWADSLHVDPEGGRGCECDLTWDLVDNAIGASEALRSRNLPRTTHNVYSRRNFVYNNNNNKAFLSQARWGRLEMKPHMKTSELNPQRKEKGDKGKGEPKNDETGKHIKRDKTHKNQQDLKGHKKRSND
jgi:hypothetical protein